MSARSIGNGHPVPGRVVVTARAYQQVIGAIAGEELAVGRRAGTVRVTDVGGRLAVHITGPVGVDATSVLDRVGRARTRIAERTTSLTGAVVDRVALHVTGTSRRERRTA